MAKKSKLITPDWIREGYDSPAEYNKARQKENPLADSSKLGQAKGLDSKPKKTGKIFKVRRCPKCGDYDVGLVLSNSDAEEGGGKEWACKKCKWVGMDIGEEELTEDEFMKYLDDKGEEVA